MTHTSGYTLVELLVVMVILGLVSALVIPRLSTPGDQTQPFAATLSGFLNAASAEANNRETPACVTLAGNVIRVDPGAQTLDIPKGVHMPSFSSYCYDLHGRVPTTQRLVVASDTDETHTAYVIVDAGYGNARTVQDTE